MNKSRGPEMTWYNTSDTMKSFILAVNFESRSSESLTAVQVLLTGLFYLHFMIGLAVRRNKIGQVYSKEQGRTPVTKGAVLD